MVSTVLSFGALYTSALLFLVGGGLLNTLLSLRMTQIGFSTLIIGLTLACYFLGLILGYFLCYRLIQRVGHIRSFAVFAAATTAIVILHGLYISATGWATLRLFSGIANFGLFMVIESWLNECTPNQIRGRVFSIYMTLTYLGIGVGQQILNIGDTDGQDLFLITALLFSLSLIPVSATRSVHPELPQPTEYKFKSLFKTAPLGMMGCVTAGLINGAFFTMGPVFGTKIGLSVFQLSWFMSATVIGGLTVQWVIGIISDRFDRTLILIILAGTIAFLSIVAMFDNGTSYHRLLVEMAIFGGLIFAIYPLAVARVNDLFEGKNAVGVSSALLLCYSVGAVFGPILSSFAMTLFKTPYGLYGYWSLVGGTFAVTAIYLRYKEKITIIEPSEQVDFMTMKNIPSTVMTLDPGTDSESDK